MFIQDFIKAIGSSLVGASLSAIEQSLDAAIKALQRKLLQISPTVRLKFNGLKICYLPRIENAAVSQLLDWDESLLVCNLSYSERWTEAKGEGGSNMSVLKVKA